MHRLGISNVFNSRFMVCVAAALAVFGCIVPLALAAPPPLPCPEAAQEAIDQISIAIAELGLPPGLASSLEAKLRAASESLGSGNGNAAQGQLGALENQIQALVKSKKITAAEGEALLKLVDQAITTITNCPVVVSGCRSSDQQNVLFWLNPTEPYAATRILYRTDGFPTGPTDSSATTLGDFPGTSGSVGTATHVSLANGTTYYYAAFVEDGAGGFSAAKTTWGRPDDSVPWSHNVGGGGTPVVGGSETAYYVLSGDGFMLALTRGATGGFWLDGWIPPRVGIPVSEGLGRRPIFLPLQTPIDGTSQMVIATSLDGRLYAVDGDTGAIIWTSQVLGPELRASVCASLKRFGGVDVVMVGTYDLTGDNKFYGINLADGTVAWVFDNGGGADGIGPISEGCSLGVTGTRVFFASLRKADGSQDSAWALDVTSTSVAKVWSVDIGDVDTSPSTRPPGLDCPDGCVYLGNNAGEVYKLNAETGLQEWPAPYFTNDGPVKGFVFRDFRTSLSAFSTDTSVHLLTDNGNSFSPVWMPAADFESPSVAVFLNFFDGNHRVYVGDGDSRVYELSATVSNPPKDKFLGLGDPARVKQPGLAFFDVRVSPQMTFWGTDESVVYAFPFPFP